jgi:hypothetical protein
MAALFVCLLTAVVLLKPQEFVSVLAGVPVVYALFAASAVAIVLGVLRGRIRVVLAPNLVLVGAFLGWGLVTTGIKRPDMLAAEVAPMLIVVALTVIVALGTASPRGIAIFGATLVGCAVTVSVVATIQGLSPTACVVAAPDDWEGRGDLEPDGRLCETAFDCVKDAANPLANYRCEHVGPWKTSSVGGRVRYRGSLADPNELTLMTAMAIPFLFALGARRGESTRTGALPVETAGRRLPILISNRLLSAVGSAIRGIPGLFVIGLIGLVTVLSKSRGGLLAYLAVIALELIRRLKMWGLVGGCLVGPPMLLLGGRSGAEAEESANERTELLREGFEFIRNTKGIGLGIGRFSDESTIGLTAHNAYVLAAAETGFVGLCLFGLVLYVSLKIPLAVWLGEHAVDPEVMRFAPAVAFSIVGAMLGIVFLSWTYKDVLYLVLGSSAALYGAARASDPSFSVRIAPKEIVAIATAMIGLVFALYVGVRLKG